MIRNREKLFHFEVRNKYYERKLLARRLIHLKVGSRTTGVKLDLTPEADVRWGGLLFIFLLSIVYTFTSALANTNTNCCDKFTALILLRYQRKNGVFEGHIVNWEILHRSNLILLLFSLFLE